MLFNRYFIGVLSKLAPFRALKKKKLSCNQNPYAHAYESISFRIGGSPDQRADPSYSASCLLPSHPRREGERKREMGGFMVDMKKMIITVLIAGILV